MSAPDFDSLLRQLIEAHQTINEMEKALREAKSMLEQWCYLKDTYSEKYMDEFFECKIDPYIKNLDGTVPSLKKRHEERIKTEANDHA